MRRDSLARLSGRSVVLLLLGAAAATSLGTLASVARAEPKAAPAAPNSPEAVFGRAQTQFDDQDYENSIQTLSALLVRPGLDAAFRVRVLKLLALDYITLGKKAEADATVRALLVTNPDYQLGKKESPRFRDFFAGVRAAWEREGRPGIEKPAPVLEPVVLRADLPLEVREGDAVSFSVAIDDRSERVQKLRARARSGRDTPFIDVPVSRTGSRVRIAVPESLVRPPLLEVVVEALGAKDEVLASRGDDDTPIRIAVNEKKKGWVLPVVIGGSVVGAAAIVGVLALAGVFGGSSSGGGSAPPPMTMVHVGVR